MLCPHCKVELRIADRQGIEIDYCPTCRGVWLDRGELDKILDRSVTMVPAAGAHSGYATPQPGGWRRDDDDRRRHYGQPGYGQPGQPGYGQPGYVQHGYRRRRESWLGDLFDFD